MSTYIIGDVQGCFRELQNLLAKIHFNNERDQLCFVGDLINRGPNNLDTLRFIKDLGGSAISVLGNHELHFIAVAHQIITANVSDTLNDLLNAPDCTELVEWLCNLPLLHHDRKLSYTMVHAGILPQWTLAMAQAHAQEVETVLRGDDRLRFLQTMYGNEPACWHEELADLDRWRFIINVFTRMRYLTAVGCLELKTKVAPPVTTELTPWFQFPERAMADEMIVFGHWASLDGVTDHERAISVDTGCVWGRTLTAYCLETGKRMMVAAE